MKLAAHSRSRLFETAARWEVPREYFDPLFNYLVHGLHPGGFWRSALANDFVAAMQHSHPANSIPQLKNTAGWIRDSFPEETWGSYRTVDRWVDKTSMSQRRSVLESQGLIYTEKEEVELILRGVKVPPEPLLW